jgi:hypothetical protein
VEKQMSKRKKRRKGLGIGSGSSTSGNLEKYNESESNNENSKPMSWIQSKRARSKRNKQNVEVGIEAEKRVAKMFRNNGYKVEHVTKEKTSHDGGIPDLKVTKKGYSTLVEVKSVRTYVDSGDGIEHGRAQFQRNEIRDLAKQGGIVVFEVRITDKKLRESKRRYYTWNYADTIYKRVKDEEGEELKYEYNQLNYDFDFEDSRWTKEVK